MSRPPSGGSATSTSMQGPIENLVFLDTSKLNSILNNVTVSVAEHSKAIQQVQTEVVALKPDTTLNDSIKSLEEQMNRLEGDVKGLPDALIQLHAANDSIADIKFRVDTIESNNESSTTQIQKLQDEVTSLIQSKQSSESLSGNVPSTIEERVSNNSAMLGRVEETLRSHRDTLKQVVSALSRGKAQANIGPVRAPTPAASIANSQQAEKAKAKAAESGKSQSASDALKSEEQQAAEGSDVKQDALTTVSSAEQIVEPDAIINEPVSVDSKASSNLNADPSASQYDSTQGSLAGGAQLSAMSGDGFSQFDMGGSMGSFQFGSQNEEVSNLKKDIAELKDIVKSMNAQMISMREELDMFAASEENEDEEEYEDSDSELEQSGSETGNQDNLQSEGEQSEPCDEQEFDVNGDTDTTVIHNQISDAEDEGTSEINDAIMDPRGSRPSTGKSSVDKNSKPSSENLENGNGSRPSTANSAAGDPVKSGQTSKPNSRPSSRESSRSVSSSRSKRSSRAGTPKAAAQVLSAKETSNEASTSSAEKEIGLGNSKTIETPPSRSGTQGSRPSTKGSSGTPLASRPGSRATVGGPSSHRKRSSTPLAQNVARGQLDGVEDPAQLIKAADDLKAKKKAIKNKRSETAVFKGVKPEELKVVQDALNAAVSEIKQLSEKQENDHIKTQEEIAALSKSLAAIEVRATDLERSTRQLTHRMAAVEDGAASKGALNLLEQSLGRRLTGAEARLRTFSGMLSSKADESTISAITLSVDTICKDVDGIRNKLTSMTDGNNNEDDVSSTLSLYNSLQKVRKELQDSEQRFQEEIKGLASIVGRNDSSVRTLQSVMARERQKRMTKDVISSMAADVIDDNSRCISCDSKLSKARQQAAGVISPSKHGRSGKPGSPSKSNALPASLGHGPSQYRARPANSPAVESPGYHGGSTSANHNAQAIPVNMAWPKGDARSGSPGQRSHIPTPEPSLFDQSTIRQAGTGTGGAATGGADSSSPPPPTAEPRSNSPSASSPPGTAEGRNRLYKGIRLTEDVKESRRKPDGHPEGSIQVKPIETKESKLAPVAGGRPSAISSWGADGEGGQDQKQNVPKAEVVLPKIS